MCAFFVAEAAAYQMKRPFKGKIFEIIIVNLFFHSRRFSLPFDTSLVILFFFTEGAVLWKRGLGKINCVKTFSLFTHTRELERKNEIQIKLICCSRCRFLVVVANIVACARFLWLTVCFLCICCGRKGSLKRVTDNQNTKTKNTFKRQGKEIWLEKIVQLNSW